MADGRHDDEGRGRAADVLRAVAPVEARDAEVDAVAGLEAPRHVARRRRVDEDVGRAVVGPDEAVGALEPGHGAREADLALGAEPRRPAARRRRRRRPAAHGRRRRGRRRRRRRRPPPPGQRLDVDGAGPAVARVDAERDGVARPGVAGERGLVDEDVGELGALAADEAVRGARRAVEHARRLAVGARRLLRAGRADVARLEAAHAAVPGDDELDGVAGLEGAVAPHVRAVHEEVVAAAVAADEAVLVAEPVDDARLDPGRRRRRARAQAPQARGGRGDARVAADQVREVAVRGRARVVERPVRRRRRGAGREPGLGGAPLVGVAVGEDDGVPHDLVRDAADVLLGHPRGGAGRRRFVGRARHDRGRRGREALRGGGVGGRRRGRRLRVGRRRGRRLGVGRRRGRRLGVGRLSGVGAFLAKEHRLLEAFGVVGGRRRRPGPRGLASSICCLPRSQSSSFA